MSEEIVIRADGHTIRFRDLAGLPGYRIGDDGSVWSRRLTGESGAGGLRLGDKWRTLSVYRRSYGARYCVVCFRPRPGGKVVARYVHRLVLETFVGPCPEGMQCCHADGDTANNRLSNLRWDTLMANVADSRRHGTHRQGSRCVQAKRNEMDILAIHFLRQLGFTQKAAGWLVGMSQSEVHAVLTGRRWAHVRRIYKALRALVAAGKI